jgi:hypothetical protein
MSNPKVERTRQSGSVAAEVERASPGDRVVPASDYAPGPAVAAPSDAMEEHSQPEIFNTAA